MNVFSYEFRAINAEGTEPGMFELHLMRGGEVVEVVSYTSDDEVEEAVRRGKEWVARMERDAT